MDSYLNNIYTHVVIIGIDLSKDIYFERLQDNSVKPILIDVFPNWPSNKDIDHFLWVNNYF